MEKIIACIDGSALSASVCDAACWVAKRLNAPLTLMHTLDQIDTPRVEDLSGTLGVDSAAHLLEQLVQLDQKRNRLASQHGKLMLEQFSRHAAEKGVQLVQQLQRHGDVVNALMESETETRLLVIGRTGQGHQSDLTAIGSHVESVVRAATRPVLISVGDFVPPANFMIAFDGSENMQSAIERTAKSALFAGLPCHLVMVGEGTDARYQSLQQAKNLLETAGFHVYASLLPGEIYTGLAQYQQENSIDLTAIGAFAHSRVRRFFIGSNTNRMIAGSQVPLLVLK